MPVPASVQRPGWPQVLGWYAAGSVGTVALWAGIGALAWAVSGAVVSVLGHLLVIGSIVALVRYGRRMPRRARVALWLGVLTPYVLAAAVVAYVLYSLAHSNLTF